MTSKNSRAISSIQLTVIEIPFAVCLRSKLAERPAVCEVIIKILSFISADHF